jgi:hypothetical protein
MAGRSDYCRCETSLEELLDDEMMEAVLRSAGFDSQGFREMIAETARRFEGPRVVELIRDVLPPTGACGV